MNRQKASLKDMIYLDGFIKNPVLVQVVGICPVAAAATSVINALALSLIFSISLILCETVASLILKKVPRWVRMAIYSVINLLVVFPTMFLLEKFSLSLFSSLGIYLPLMAFNSLNCVRCEKFAVKNSVKLSFFDSIACSVGYCSVLIAIGLIREIFGNGTFLGADIPFIGGMNGLLMPFGGLFIIGILAAFHKSRVIKNHPDKLKETETKFVLDESDDKEATFTYALKHRFKKNSTL
ncbi:MAG: hypothetical protein IJZ88_06960 [Clostridia bacterium]|nr:hypothetical protein [Clostridia bacterium]